MAFSVHHQPLELGLSWHLWAWQLAWDGNATWDVAGVANGALVDFAFPDVLEPRKLSFKYRSVAASDGKVAWERDDFERQLADAVMGDIWTFEQSRRVLYRAPRAARDAAFRAGDVLTFNVITKSRFAHGRLYVWDPYQSDAPSAFFLEAARDDAAGVSTFSVSLAAWMTNGFHLKLVGRDASGNDSWEPDASNRVWRPSDGTELWLKSGQCDVRNEPLALTTLSVQVLMPASLPPPALTLRDSVEALEFDVTATSSAVFADSNLLKVVSYEPQIYPQAAYTLRAGSNESSPIVRPFPANPADPEEPSRFALGAGSWLAAFPTATEVELRIEPRAPSSFDAGVAAQVSLGNSSPYQTIAAVRDGEGSWRASLTVLAETTTQVQLLPAVGSEPKPYAWLDTGRYFTPNGAATLFTTEGVFGVTRRGKTTFAEVASRPALMTATFGSAVANSGIFAANELPHGTTLLDGQVHFVLHAPHAVWAELVLIVAGARRSFPLSLTPDARYWWCAVPANIAAPGTRYRFVLNDNLEVLDPAAREVDDRGSFDVSFGADPNDPTTAWSLVADIERARQLAQAQPWQTMGWQNLAIYEMHAARFTDLSPAGLKPLELLIDELANPSRLGRPGYLSALPVTALELLPVQEFSSSISWGYDPSFYFAIDGHYGGNLAFARFVNAAHASGRAVLLDVVYNHSLGSSLMKIAPDVYRNGDYDGDRMNCGHPMVLELLRQATLHLWGTFGIDGFRFDDTKTIVTECVGGWEFLANLRASLRAAAAATGRAWPYCVAENSATAPWDISNPGFGVLDGQWGIDESYRIRDASYDTWNASADDAGALLQEMNNPAYWGRPFFQAVRFGESHDMVSEQDPGNKRIAKRPPFGQGLELAKAMGALTLLSNGIPMLFMGQEYGETVPFSFESTSPALNPQFCTAPDAPTGNARVLAWFRALLGLRNDPTQGLQGDSNYQVVGSGHRTVAFTCGAGQRLFAVVTFGTANQTQDSSWLGLPGGGVYKEIFNSSWPVFAVESEPERTNGGYDARITSGRLLELPFIGALVLQRV